MDVEADRGRNSGLTVSLYPIVREAQVRILNLFDENRRLNRRPGMGASPDSSPHNSYPWARNWDQHNWALKIPGLTILGNCFILTVLTTMKARYIMSMR